MTDDETPDPGVHEERITLPDGRYLIYYTFDDSDAPESGAAS
ncbi:MAG TPA: hypothetical protein VHS78_02910 [Candidatus Elarobacter sp.]|jgi:hypothetical protein|nr:hypothetical protein [Candidatus Elarobacter sp.]